jgi:hypothetical protein
MDLSWSAETIITKQIQNDACGAMKFSNKVFTRFARKLTNCIESQAKFIEMPGRTSGR